MADRTDAPNWLTGAEQDAWQVVVALMFRLPAALDAQLRRDAALTHFEYGVLASLSAAPARTMRMSALAARNNSSLSRLSHVVKRMEERSWVERSPLSGDGRVTVARLTDGGQGALGSAAPGHVAEVRRLVIDSLTPRQLAELREIGARIIANIEPGVD